MLFEIVVVVLLFFSFFNKINSFEKNSNESEMNEREKNFLCFVKLIEIDSDEIILGKILRRIEGKLLIGGRNNK